MSKDKVTEVFGEPISVYTSNQAVEDGILLNLKVLENKIKGITAPNAPFSHITTNLLTKHGYMTENSTIKCGHQFKDIEGIWVKPTMNECPHCYTKANQVTFNYPNILDLLNQALQIIKKGPKGDWMYSGKIETPNGNKQTIFIQQNETGKFTILLPEDN